MISVTFGYSQKESNQKCLELWTAFTMGDFTNLNAHKIASKDWPFKIISKTGDVVDRKILESIESHNDSIWRILEAKSYTEPKSKYFKQFKKEKKRIQTLLELVNNNSKVIKLNKSLNERSLNEYSELEKINDSIYLMKIYSFNMNNLSDELKLELKIEVNIDTNRLTIKHK